MTIADRLPRWTPSRWDRPLDREMLSRLETRAATAGILGPGPQWSFSSDHIASLRDMIHAWVGWGRLPVTATSAESIETTGHSDFATHVLRHVAQIDHLGLITPSFVDHARKHQWLVADLYSLMDVLELTAFLGATNGPKVRILEIGGGWGRLAEMMLKLFPGLVEYVMVDAVPISLVSAEAYLRHELPKASIGSFISGDIYQPGSFDLYFVPSWEVEQLGTARFDAVVNIESFQEMTQEQVDLYIGWFDQMIADNGIAYIANSHDYVMKGNWSYPSSWRTLARHRTPRSWTIDNSTHILRKEVGHFAAANAIIDVSYAETLPVSANPGVIAAEQRRVIVGVA